MACPSDAAFKYVMWAQGGLCRQLHQVWENFADHRNKNFSLFGSSGLLSEHINFGLSRYWVMTKFDQFQLWERQLQKYNVDEKWVPSQVLLIYSIAVFLLYSSHFLLCSHSHCSTDTNYFGFAATRIIQNDRTGSDRRGRSQELKDEYTDKPKVWQQSRPEEILVSVLRTQKRKLIFYDRNCWTLKW